MSSFDLYTLKLWLSHNSHSDESLNHLSQSLPSIVTRVAPLSQRPAQRRGTGSSVPLKNWWRRSCRRRDSGRAASRTTGSCCPIANSSVRVPVGDTALWFNTHNHKLRFFWRRASSEGERSALLGLVKGTFAVCTLSVSQLSLSPSIPSCYFSIIASQSDITCSLCKPFM